MEGSSSTDVIQAVLDTSAWVAAKRAEVAANLLDLFQVVVPQAVVEEITAREPGFPRREYPHATLFRHLLDRMLVVPAEETPDPPRLFGAGEAAAIALAQRDRLLVLINEHRAASYAVNLGLRVVTIPSVIVDLHQMGVISTRAAHRKLDLIASLTNAALIERARQEVDAAGLP